jgi:putative membrane protein
MFRNKERHSSLKGLAAGAIGGLVASFAMNQFQAGLSKLVEHPRQSPGKKRRARQAQGWREHREPTGGDGEVENATVKAAAAVSEAVLDHELRPEEREPAGNAIHYAQGVVSGAIYGLAAEEWRGVRAGAGTGFGAAVWLAADEVAVPVLKLSKPPREYPLRVHAMALGAHLVYGFTTEMVRRALRPERRGLWKW